MATTTATSETLPTTSQETVLTPETTDNKSVPYTRFAEMVSEKKALAEKLAVYEAKQVEAERVAAEKVAKETGDFETYKAQLKAERETEKAERIAEKAKLNSMVKSTYLESLASKHSIAKPEYLALFAAEVEIDNMEIKNADKVASAFETFKTENPNLFLTPDKKVPTTDNKPVKQPRTVAATTETSGVDKIRMGLEEFLKK